MGIWLASASERRAQILRDRYGTVHIESLPDVDETPPTGSVSSQVLAICRRKAEAVPAGHGYQAVIVADTMVGDPDDANAAMGKAENESEALSMLKRLSGRRHQVWSATGVQICGDWTFFVEFAVVEIDDLSVDVIGDLIKSGSWIGKAGSYDLAGQMSKYAKLIDGDEVTVLGFASSALRLLD
ncbi:MAG: Maf-like protein [Candidatus Poseidoniales archaeon]|nr:MAG: Maf-like protein [Candidatus Poseidoniales archaeon]